LDSTRGAFLSSKNVSVNVNKLGAIILGNTLCSIALNGFFIPNKLLSGGVGGVSIMIYFLTQIPTSLLIFLINIPIFLIGMKIIDKEFAAYSFISMLFLSFSMELTADIGKYIVLDDIVLAAVFGAIFNGLGMGILFRNRVSQGGLDIIAAILKKKYNINVGTGLMVFNTFIVAIASTLFGLKPAMYTLIAMYIAYQIVDKVQEGLDQTGYEEVSLLSLSSSDYTDIIPLIEGLRELLQERQVNISLPSLRIESFSEELMDVLQTLSPGGGFTLAPEAGTERLRAVINKPLSDEAFLETVRSVYQHGWQSIKLYFMIGHPQETIADIEAIITLCKAALQEGKRTIGGRAKLHAGISTFIPKPHTPFQWAAFDNLDAIQEKLSLLREGLRGAKIKMSWNNPESSLLEAWLSRGDRRIAEVIYHAWKNGARFDAWSEHFNIDHWRAAFATADLDPDFYSHRVRTLDETLPWDHINAGVRKSFLRQDYQWSLEGKIRPDCRLGCYACGILSAFSELRLISPDGGWKCP